MRSSNRQLAKNTVALYALSFSSQIINIVLIPYETRVLGSAAYGVVSLGASLSIVLGLVFDFGFILSATGEVAKSDRSNEFLSKIFSDVTAIKILLIIITSALLIVPLNLISPFRENKLLFVLYFLAYAINAFLPDYIYRGVEDMKAISIRTVLVRLLFAAPILIFVKRSQDAWLIPLFLLLGNTVAVIYSVADLKIRYNIKLETPSKMDIVALMKKSAPYFISRFASTFYQSMNSIILGLLYPGQPVVGNYAAAEKYLSVVRQCSSPIADSVYPYMLRTKDYRTCIKIMIICVPVIIGCSIPAYIYAEQISVFLFGVGYEYAGHLLRALLPAIIVILPTYIICFPMLVPMGLSDKANFSNIIGAVCQLACLLLCLLSNRLDAFTLCLSSSCSEVSVFLYRLTILIMNRDKFKESTNEK